MQTRKESQVVTDTGITDTYQETVSEAGQICRSENNVVTDAGITDKSKKSFHKQGDIGDQKRITGTN